ncbi:MAG: T9SS type A sorting domain-containing protein [Saprospiraceae bacterium]|nr:T9SS type A sorting domain-containing protein [Saprospiraceae bacterium]
MTYSLMMSAKEYARALAFLQALIPTSEDEFDFIEVQEIYHQYLTDPTGYNLNNTDRNTIYNAGNKRLELAGFARKVYHLLTGERIFLDVPMYDDPRGATREVEEAVTKFNIYPNPSIQNADLTIEVDADFLSEINPVFKVYNAQGQLLIANTLRNKQQTVVMPDLSGLLFISIERDGAVLHSQKLIRL